MNLLKALLFGIAMALAIGPIALLIVNNGLRHGAGAGLRSALGASLADCGYGLMALVAGQQAVRWLSANEPAFTLGSSAVLAGFGLWMVRGALRLSEDACCREAEASGRRAGTGVLGTFALTVVNPLTIIGFLGFTGQLRLSGSWWEAPALALAIGAGSFAVGAALALFAAALSRWLHRPRIIRRLNLGSGLGIAAFGFYGCWPVIQTWV